MKKIAMMMKVVTLVLSLAITAQAELHVEHWRVESTVDGESSYYVTYVSETGDSYEYSVTEDEFYEAVEELAAARKAEEESTQEEPRPWTASVLSTITFWNPND